MVEKTAELPVTQKLLDRIVQSPQHLIVLETANVAETLAQMRTLAMRGGTSVYVWSPDTGIASLRESGLNVPGSKRIADALRYVLQSMHFGIYLFVDFAAYLRPVDTLLLRRISRMQAINERKLVFVGSQLELPEELEGMFERLTVETEHQHHLRLRDGRWVQ
ncbi:hypothetical protein [Dokdonella soli]|uniref:Uncharacterized protein n=1 Tax=Dokdonella soli TaxID=529810 RepID=A0ABN1IDP0_9GAMM